MPKINLSSIRSYYVRKIIIFWSDWIGSPSEFSLESRIFHSISIGLIILSSVYVPYNLYSGLYVGSASALLIGSFYGYQYYYSRYYNKAHSSTLFGVLGILVFGVNYFTNSGIDGSTDLIWPIHLLLVLAISPYNQHLRWVIIYLVTFLILHAIEYYYPHLVQHPFTAGKGQFLDRVTAFPLPVIAVYIVIKFIRRSYDAEKRATEEKAMAVEASKAQILAQKDQLEQSNIEKNKLMSIISHDLRTPLMNVQKYLELLNEGEVDSEDRPMLEMSLLKSTNSAMDMLSNLLNWSKSQMEGVKVNLVKVDLMEALISTLDMQKIQALTKNIVVTFNIPPKLMVVADIDMLQLVLRNLISNAIKFTPSGREIKVTAMTILQECKITVADNGSGIPEAKQHKIFTIKSEPTYGNNNEKGVGLGLVLCKEFIERQGGRITFESREGQGSSFMIFVPISPKLPK